jgi:molybdopterin-dependent oxidoreductase alpha subunit
MSLPLVPLRKRAIPIASMVPFGLRSQKPRHFLEMARVTWENRDQLGYAWRILSRGVCDGCALGTTGMRDWTLSGTHLCAVRLNLLRLNTIGPIADDAFADAQALQNKNGKELRALGRIPYPLRRRRGERGFSRVSWDEALRELGVRLRQSDPRRVATFMTSRGITNEVYYATQKALRCYGSPHVDNAARLCHSPSTAAMKRVLGVAASTCSYKDWYGSDVVILFGSNPANDQPVAMKYLLEAKKRGTRVYVVNTYEEPGLKRYWVPSTPESALFGSEIADGFFPVTTGGDLAFLQAVQRLLVERGQIDHEFVAAHTEGFEELRTQLLDLDLERLIAASGATRADIERFASILAEAQSGVFVWSMGLTQHVHGTDTVGALCTLGLLKGFIGREKCGLMPIRGHSGVQGGSEMGAYSNMFPGGVAIDDESADRFASLWGFRPPVETGLTTSQMLEAAYRHELDVFYNIGGNLRDTLPDPARVETALARVPVRIHQDIVLTHPMLVEPCDTVFLLPARTRYEHRGGVTETTTERRVVFSPYIPGHELEETREEWWIARELIRAACPERAELLGLEDAAAIRREIAEAVPSYRGIEQLEKQGDQFQWGGPTLCVNGIFPLPSGKARLELRPLPMRELASDQLWLATRRGKQFNSIVQAQVDGLTGAARDHIFMSSQDMQRFGLVQDARVRLKSAYGTFEGRVFESPVTPGNLQMFWPESNVLLTSGKLDPAGLVPDYNAAVRIERLT